MVRTEDHWNAIDSGFECIVNAYAKASADISHVTIAIYAAQETNGVDDDAIDILHLALIELRIAHKWALESGDDALHMLLVYLVRRYDELHLWMRVEVLE